MGDGDVGCDGEWGGEHVARRPRWPQPAAGAGEALTNVKSISLGFGSAAALLHDGTLRMWGFDGYGQIGVGTSGSYHLRPMAVKVITNVASVHLGNMPSFAVRSDGSLWILGKRVERRAGDTRQKPARADAAGAAVA